MNVIINIDKMQDEETFFSIDIDDLELLFAGDGTVLFLEVNVNKKNQEINISYAQNSFVLDNCFSTYNIAIKLVPSLKDSQLCNNYACQFSFSKPNT